MFWKKKLATQARIRKLVKKILKLLVIILVTLINDTSVVTLVLLHYKIALFQNANITKSYLREHANYIL